MLGLTYVTLRKKYSALVTDMLKERKILNEIHFGKGVLAQQLHQKAGVHEGLCGILKIDKFQTVVDDYQLQIIVLSAKQSNVIVYEGPRQEQQIYLYHCENHFDIITPVSSFLGRRYFCLECKKAYNVKEKHRYSVICKCCFT